MSAVPRSLPTPDAATELSMAVGFIGLGRMGLPFSQRLVHAKLPIVVWDRTQSKVELAVADGAKWAQSPNDLARSVGKGITFVMVTDYPAVKQVLLGLKGFARGAPAGALVVNLSTIDPEESRDLSKRLGERGIHYLDSPVAGSVEQVVRGEVVFFVGGEGADVARARPLLERMGRGVEHMGPVGTGSAMKLVNNLLTIGITVLSTEALALADGFHLERSRVIEVLLAGGGNSTMLERKAPNFLSRSYPAQFTTALARKDLKLVEKASARDGRSLKMTREARKLVEDAIAQGHAEDDFSSVLEATLARGRSTVAQSAASAAAVPPAEP